MSTRTHTTVTGHHIEYTATPRVSAFLARLEKLVADPNVTEQNMIGLAYSHENPLLDCSIHPTRGMVTKAVLDDPAYAVMSDLLFRKRIAQDNVSIEKVAARFSMTIPEAAAELGIHESAVRQAIAAKRLASWIKESRHYVDPRSLKTLEVGTRGPTKKARAASEEAAPESPLEICMGSETGASLNVKAPNPIEIVSQSGRTHQGSVSRWRRVVVRTTEAGGSKRAFVIVPGAEENEIKHGTFHVRGRFDIVEKSNNPKKADELWKTTSPE